MKWILVGLGIVVGIAVLNIAIAMFTDSKVLAAAAAKGFDARYEMVKGSPRYIELVYLLKQCRAKSLTIEQSADVIVEKFS